MYDWYISVENILPILALATVGSLAGLMGGLLILSSKTWTQKLSLHAVPFAAGVLLSVALLDILPEALEQAGAETIMPAVLAVMVAAFLFEQFLGHLHHHQERPRTLHSSIPLVVFGDTIHNFIDGVVIAASFLVQPTLGMIVALATFLHEVPHEMGDFGLMLQAGWKKQQVILVNILSALATYLGAVMVLTFSAAFAENLGLLLAIAGGLFLYIGASDLLPEVGHQHKQSFKQALLLLLGVALTWLLTQLFPHG